MGALVIKFLVVDRISQARPYAQERGWTQLGFARYGTEEKDDIRVVERTTELFLLSGGIKLIKGPGYEELLTSPDEGDWAKLARERAEQFEKLVESGGARWVE